MKPVLAIVNRAAGHGRAAKLAPDAIAQLRGFGFAVEVRETSGPGDATNIARQAVAHGQRELIAVGGDGTSFEILNGLTAQLGATDPRERVCLGFLPLGTGNSFLKDFGPGGVDHALDALRMRRRRACDAVKLTHDSGSLHYINILSFGFVADVCSVTNRRFKRFGPAGYGLGVVSTLAGLHSRKLRMRIDGGALWEQDATFVSLNNSRFTGGNMQMAPYADTGDGQIDVVVCGPMTRLTLLETFPQIFRGHHVHHHAISSSRAKSIELLEDGPIDLMIDGEVLRHQPLRVDVVPSALDVWV
jgi:YegS/Rv2252/BmrU family lipid kinase